MFKTAATKIAHNSTLPALSIAGNKDLRPLQDLITAEKSVLISLQKLSQDINKASDALRMWGAGEGEDLNDTLRTSAELLAHFSDALSKYATDEHTVRDQMKAVRTREEALDDLRKRRKAVGSKAESAEKKLSKMGAEHKNLGQQTELLNSLQEQMRQLDGEILSEETRLGDFKRWSTRMWMAVKFGSLAYCSEIGSIIARSGKQVVAEIPEETTTPGMPRSMYYGHDKTSRFAMEAQQHMSTVAYSADLIPNAFVPESQALSPPVGPGQVPVYNAPEIPPTAPGYVTSPYLTTPALSDGLGLDSYISPPAPGEDDHGSPNPVQATPAPPFESSPWDTRSPLLQSPPQITPSNPLPRIDSTLSHQREGSVDDFGVNVNSLYSPRLGATPEGGRFATFPAKRSQLPFELDAPGETDSFSSSVQAALLGSSSSQAPPNDLEGSTLASQRASVDTTVSAAPSYRSMDPNQESATAGPGLRPIDNPWDRPGSQYSDTDLAYDAVDHTDPYQRLSRHVRFGQEEIAGYGVGVVDTPTPTASYNNTPLSATFADRGESMHMPEPSVPSSVESAATATASATQEAPQSPPPRSISPPSEVARQTSPPAPEAMARQTSPTTSRALEALHRIRAPSFDFSNIPDDPIDEKAHNAAAARQIGLEMGQTPYQPPVRTADSSSSYAPPEQESYERTSQDLPSYSNHASSPPTLDIPPPPPLKDETMPISPVKSIPNPPVLPIAQPASPSSQVVSPPIDTKENPPSPPSPIQQQPQSPSSIKSQPQTLPPLSPPKLSLPTRTMSAGSTTSSITSNSAFRTPPEYPRAPSTLSGLNNKSSTSLNSQPPPPGVRTISAAAFRRGNNRTASDSVSGPSLGAGSSPIADTSPLSFKKRTLPSSPYPQQRMQSRDLGAAPGDDGFSSPSSLGSTLRVRSDSRSVSAPAPALPPGAAAAASPSIPPPPALSEEPDFNYLTAYVNGGGQDEQQHHEQNGGYNSGRFTTNLDEDRNGGLR